MANPTESTEERIFANVEEVLAKIRKADGYWYDVAPESVTRRERTLEQIMSREMPYLQIIDGDSSWQPEETHMPKRPLHIVEVIIDGLVKETDPEKKMTAVNRVIRDVMKKLQEDTGRGLFLTAKNALYTRIASIERFDAATGYDDFGAFRITAEVFYRYDWTAP